MELTIEQILQQGITAHTEGKLQEAERLYSTILQSQPAHPDANHNLGVIAVSVDKVELALPLFKAALEANPKVEQFWLSYISTLIKENQFQTAKNVLAEGKKIGLVGDKIDVLEAQLKPITQSALPKLPDIKKSLTLKEKRKKIAESKQQKKQVKSKNANSLSPSQSQADNLLEHYQNGRYDEAEKLAVSITEQFPKYQYGWKVLGAIFKNTDRISEALDANQKSVTLSPQDPEAYSNLGATLRGLGRLDEAVASYRHAIMLKPNLAEAHHNLGNALKELGRLDAAEASYRCAIVLKPNYAEAQYNLGATLQQLGRLEESEASYRHAIALKSDYAEAKHMLASLTGETTHSAPRTYVENLFDEYASKFDHSLVDNLEYKIPKKIVEMILKNHSGEMLGSILDLGCGTGLTGVEIKKYCMNIEGIDLSARMLEKARKKNVYDRLTNRDIVDYLSTENLNFDYFISTDVFIYVGDLCDVFRLIKSRNSSGGKLVFSTEHTDKHGFFLQKTGRYSHSKTYIESLCEQYNYTLSHFEIGHLRKDKDIYITGGLYLLDF